MLELDGARGEGGGQVLRTSLTLSMITGTPVRIRRIRAGRRRPGLLRQHLTAAKAAAEICGGRLEGADLGSSRLTFEPGEIIPGQYHFAVGTAGSTTLVLQTVLPALLTAPHRSTLVLEGGTHNPMAPPFPFLTKAFLPLVERMGPRVEVTLERAGFYPAGGGRLQVTVTPSERLEGFELHERGALLERRATAILAQLPRHIGERELRHVQREMGWADSELHLEEVRSTGPGNLLLLEVRNEHITEVFTGFGQRGVRAEAVAHRAVKELRRYLEAEDVPVGEYLADQLILLLALAADRGAGSGGGLTTLPLSRHATTQIELLHSFLEVEIHVEHLDSQRALVRLS